MPLSAENITLPDEQYWDSVAQIAAPGDKSIRDNFGKRQHIIKLLCDYYFTGAKVLEIGCGLGVTAAVLKVMTGWDFTYKGVDISQKFCDAAKRMFNHDVYRCRANNLPFPDKEFSALFAFDVLEHIPPDDRDGVYKELDRVLGDTAAIFINNPLSQSKHDPNFDFSFKDMDTAKMAAALNMTIIQLTTYDFKGYWYQFIVLGRKV